MHIYWLGESAIRIETKNAEEAVVLLIDPYKPELGNAPRSIKSDIVLYSRGEKNSVTISGEPYIMTTPGEIETKNVLVFGVNSPKSSKDKESVLWFLEAEGISIGHVGACGKELTDKELETLSGVDILFIPVGGGDYPDAEEASKIVTQVEPRIVVPICYASTKGEKLATLNSFLKEVGAEGVEPVEKLKISKKELPQDEMKIIPIERT